MKRRENMGNILLTVPEFCFTDWQVCLLGIGTVFVGLIVIILLCKILGLLVGKAVKEEKTDAESAPQTNAIADEIPNREEFVAAVSAALAEYMGEDINSFRIVSIKKI